jgi:hypothetical protein
VLPCYTDLFAAQNLGFEMASFAGLQTLSNKVHNLMNLLVLKIAEVIVSFVMSMSGNKAGMTWQNL